MLAALVLNGLASMEGRVFTEAGNCPVCGGTVSGYDRKRRFFARIQDEEVSRDVEVVVTRYTCKGCRRLIVAPAPFYPGTRVGAPVIDLSWALSREMPAYRVANVMSEMGVLVDQGSVRSWAARDAWGLKITRLFGHPIPLSVLALSLPAPGSEPGLYESRPVVRTE
jgi:transposase